MQDFKNIGQPADALFTLTLHRGEGMCLLAMNWKNDQRPPDDFVGFMIEYREPGGDRFWTLNNRLSFTDASKITDKAQLSTRMSLIQKFRWVHFPSDASLAGTYNYRVSPVFMSPSGELSYGVAQSADVALKRETYPGVLDVWFTRGFVSSQAFAQRYGNAHVYLGSFNFSAAADHKNGENLLEIRNRRATTAFADQAISMFDHYHFREVSAKAGASSAPRVLAKPPSPGGKPWFDDDFSVPYKICDRQIFSDQSI